METLTNLDLFIIWLFVITFLISVGVLAVAFLFSHDETPEAERVTVKNGRSVPGQPSYRGE